MRNNDTYRLISSISSLIVLLILFFFSSGVVAENQTMYFFGQTVNNEQTDIIYVGESRIFFKVIHPENCTGYGVFINSELFVEPLNGYFLSNESKGSGHIIGLSINPSINPGNYSVNCLFSYFNQENETINITANLPLRVINPLEILNISIPKSSDKEFKIIYRININLTSLDIILDSDGDLILDADSFSINTPIAGTYSIAVKVTRGEEKGTPGISYHFKGCISNRTFEQCEYHIPVHLDWNNNEIENDLLPSTSITFKILLLIIFAVVIILLYSMKKRKGDTF